MSAGNSPQVETAQAGSSPPAWRELVLIFGLATATIGSAPILHLANPILAIAVEVLVGIAIVVAVPSYAPAIAIFVLFFQNLFVSILSPLVPLPSDLDFIKGYNFLVCSVMWLATFGLYVLGQRNQSEEVNRIMRWGVVTLAVVSLYFAIGFSQDGQPAAVYLRNIVLPLFLFQLSLLTAATYEVRITPFLVTLAVILMLCGYVELVFRDVWLAITNGYTFWGFDELKATHSGVWETQMRQTGNVPVTLQDRFSFDFLNTPLLEGFGLSKMLRINGPNMHPISFAYGVGFCALFLFSVGRPLLALAALPLLVFCSVKGALIVAIFVAAAWIATRLLGAVVTLLLGFLGLIAFAVLAIRVGLQIGDYHVIGLMGGLDGFVQRPFGRGLGIGGNLSDSYFSIDWSAAQAAGTIDGAVESAIGVLLYQMGIAAFVPLGFYVAVALKAWRLYASSGYLTQGLAGFGVMVVLVNGLFQEEALFAPLALGLMLSLAGLVIGSHVRMQAVASQDTEIEPLTHYQPAT
ncbi:MULTISPECIES: hypothetical protein [unclassified Bradyrhizobium]|uniref:hypothetical protein n=1 Tax=unclassified Bradyrhizobium TaxID=2631580 RepID=UPI00211EFAF9|nr:MULTISPECIES: hypothetical protein [unclassified Bradyrhizobium]MDD1535740.1 hypothetical protein [Bradyrhizobium sp. WBOS8]MDD1585306.1 hypothetical protein [Bradyrhizobium sp. WBOS4]UUO45758.1 hypothetical protein DCM78_01685 [Bradyrhizobium sp. WBOS04]UUO59408.1 hypothetical protein DCM80_09600 [Bradyrhizobium sp. WBOS08]